MFKQIIQRFHTPPLYFVHRIDQNIGDVMSAPYRYYTFPSHRIIDICNTKQINAIPENKSIILGGGGLMMPYFDSYRAAVLNRNPSKVVWWGVGERRIQNLPDAFIDEQAVHDSIQPNWFNAHHLVGFRQQTSYYPFLPCVSCKAIELYRNKTTQASIQHQVVQFEHAHVPLPKLPTIPKLTNAETSSDAMFNFLDSAKVVVTNSYHGMYWAALLGKQVVVVPFSSGLYHHPWQVHVASPQNLNKVIDQALLLSIPSNSGMLEQCVSLNDAFYNKVLNYLASS